MLMSNMEFFAFGFLPDIKVMCDVENLVTVCNYVLNQIACVGI